MKNLWNERFSSDEYVYGTEPNAFLEDFYENNSNLFLNPVLMLGDGEGRNGVYLATKGLDVTSLDFAEKGLEKARKLAREKNVTLKTILADVNEYRFEENCWGTIVLIYLHLTKSERVKLFENIKKSLKASGIFFLEAFSTEQLNYNSGGPKDIDLLYTKEELENFFIRDSHEKKFEVLVSQQTITLLHEGRLHEGEGSVVRFVCKKL